MPISLPDPAPTDRRRNLKNGTQNQAAPSRDAVLAAVLIYLAAIQELLKHDAELNEREGDALAELADRYKCGRAGANAGDGEKGTRRAGASARPSRDPRLSHRIRTGGAIGLVIPELEGKLDGTAIRVPTPNVSLVSLDLVLEAKATASQINDAMKAASQGKLRGILDYNTEQLVSVDFNYNPASCIFDATLTKVVDDGLAHVTGWYDNEWGFSCRMLDTAALVGSL